MATRRNGKVRPTYKSCGKMVISDAKKALRLARHVKSMINVEFKFLDFNATAAGQPESVTLGQVSNIAQGDGGSARDGNQVKLTGIYLTYMWTISASATNTQVRVLLVLDKQTNGVIYAAGDLLHDTSINDNIVSPYNLDNKYRFRVLYDRVHHLSDNGNQSVSVKRYIKMNEKLRFDGTTADIANLTSSSITLVTMSSETTNVPLITRNVRLRYVDN